MTLAGSLKSSNGLLKYEEVYMIFEVGSFAGALPRWQPPLSRNLLVDPIQLAEETTSGDTAGTTFASAV